MNSSPVSLSLPTWQDSLDLLLMQRLWHRLEQPGVLKSDLSNAILTRTERFARHLAFGQNLMQRYRSAAKAPTDDIPIVYAQPLVFNPAGNADSPSVSSDRSEATPSPPRLVIQAKFATSHSVTQPILQHLTQVISSTSLTHSDLPTQPSLPAMKQPGDQDLHFVMERERLSALSNPFSTSPSLPITDLSESDAGQIPLVYAQYRSPDDSSDPSKDGDRPSSLPTVTPLSPTQPAIAATIPLVQPIVPGQPYPSPPTVAQTLPFRQFPLPNQPQPLSAEHPLVFAQTVPMATPITDAESSYISRDRPSPTITAHSRPIVPAAIPQPESGKWQGSETPLVFSSSPANRGMGVAPSSPGVPGNQSFNAPTAPVQAFPRSVSTDGALPESAASHATQRQPVAPPAKLDMEAIADKVERKLMRRLMVERERRGQSKWR